MTNNDNVYNPKRAWYELKPTLVDRAAPFDFNLVKLKNTGYIFLGTAIFAPFFINILISYMFTHNEYALAGMNFISWIIVAIGSYFVISGAQNEIMRSGAIAFYYFYFIPNIIGLVIGTIVNQFHPSDSVKTTINLLTLIIAGLVTIFILYLSSPLIFEKIKLTLKQDCKRFFVVCSISIIAVFSIHLFFVYLQSLITATTSNNQNNLIKGLDKWWNIAFLFIYTILIAPVVEELATRHGIFSLSGNKWLGFVASTIFFTGMHVAGTGDWEHFIGYIGASLTLGMLFFIVNGNVTYTIIPHVGYNCIVVILTLAAPKFLA
ncbi:CPBP family intramembrane glutamic endopeptidase [Spiroplasma endosymbiont of Ammophila pubescens]|uniref:CPBP family intramembrane glutamic endopeptidase n=1 Tax=Spiroplasma endosymbiont of Ammophila pubescens TaxID=3066315 RepID=UPI0032B1D99F